MSGVSCDAWMRHGEHDLELRLLYSFGLLKFAKTCILPFLFASCSFSIVEKIWHVQDLRDTIHYHRLCRKVTPRAIKRLGKRGDVLCIENGSKSAVTLAWTYMNKRSRSRITNIEIDTRHRKDTYLTRNDKRYTFTFGFWFGESSLIRVCACM